VGRDTGAASGGCSRPAPGERADRRRQPAARAAGFPLADAEPQQPVPRPLRGETQPAAAPSCTNRPTAHGERLERCRHDGEVDPVGRRRNWERQVPLRPRGAASRRGEPRSPSRRRRRRRRRRTSSGGEPTAHEATAQLGPRSTPSRRASCGAGLSNERIVGELAHHHRAGPGSIACRPPRPARRLRG